MKDWKKVCRCIFCRHWLMRFFLTILSTVLLIYAFAVPDANPVIVYSSYGISAYTLIIVIVGFPPIIRKIKAGLYANKYSSRYLSEPELRARISLYLGCAINIGYAIFKFTAGVYYKSVWLGAMAVYYIILSLIRFGLLKRERYSSKFEDDYEQRMYGLKSYRFCGCLMFLLNIAVSGLVIQLIWKNESYEYPGFLIYASAAYAFYCFITAVINAVKFRRMEKPVLSAAKMLSLACALMSILALQTAMLTQFGEGQKLFERVMNSITGSVVCFMVFAMAVWMIHKANIEIKRMESQNE